MELERADNQDKKPDSSRYFEEGDDFPPFAIYLGGPLIPLNKIAGKPNGDGADPIIDRCIMPKGDEHGFIPHNIVARLLANRMEDSSPIIHPYAQKDIKRTKATLFDLHQSKLDNRHNRCSSPLR